MKGLISVLSPLRKPFCEEGRSKRRAANSSSRSRQAAEYKHLRMLMSETDRYDSGLDKFSRLGEGEEEIEGG